MADEEKKLVFEEPSKATDGIKADKTKMGENHHWHNGKCPANWVVGALVAVIVLLAGGFIGSIAVNRHRRVEATVMSGVMGNGFESAGRMGRDGGMRGNGMRGGMNSNQQRLSGVVTALGTDSFTLAGNGITNTVKTNNDTDYNNATKVAVNDSVVAVGTTSNGTFTASAVYIYNTSTTDSL
jgi:hypothetical protein